MSHVQPLECRTFLSAGQLDSSFGDGGIVTFDPTAQREDISLFAQTSGGKLLIAGRGADSGGEPYVMRLNADGSPDETFGPGGNKSVALPDGAFAVDPTIGRVLIAARGNGGEVTAYNPDFTIDTSFGGGDGKIAVDGVTIGAIRFGAGGKIVVGGVGSTAPGTSALFVHRFNANGTPDTSFDGDGEALTGATTVDLSLQDLQLAADGSIFIAARTDFHGGNEITGDVDDTRLLVYKLTENGGVDSTFSGDGKVQIFLDQARRVTRVLDLDIVDGDEPVVLWETSIGADDDSVYRLSRFTAAGEGGEVPFLPPFPKLSLPNLHVSLSSFGIDPEGRVVAVGRAFNEAGHNDGMFATRYLPDGSVDTSYGTFGVFVGEFTNSRNATRSIITPQGEVLDARAHGDSESTNVNATLRVTKLQGGAGEAPDVAINADRNIVVTATQTGDTIRVHRRSDGRIVVRVGEFARSFSGTRAKRVVINAIGGNDSVTIAGVPASVDGGDGHDSITGGNDDDVLLGGPGKDRIAGGAGDDLIKGGGGNDYLLGNSGGDTILGQGGRDRVRGAGGNDNLFGGAGDDSLIGGVGNDRAANDPLDTRDEIEMLL